MKNQKYLQVFKQLGDSLSQEEILQNLAEIEQFICALYKTPKKYTEVNGARLYLFRNKLTKNKTIDLAMLPPCKSVLHLHLKRATFIAHMWKSSHSVTVNLPDITEYGWYADGSVEWVEEVYPSVVGEIIESTTNNENYEMEADSDTESDDSDSDGF